MWFAKQGPALAYHDAHPDHLTIAKCISRHGHKKYGVVPRADIDNYRGPFNELIRTHSACRLYFDLDGEGDVDVLVAEVRNKLREVYRVGADRVIVHCSSTPTKFSKHVIFPDVVFKNNWEHMKAFVHGVVRRSPQYLYRSIESDKMTF